jgi:DNA-directed RNA polymerase subunit M/transcription elongation factor TFIIS
LKEDLLQKAAEYLQQARKLPPGADRNELRQIALGLKWMARRKLEMAAKSNSTLLSIERPRCGRCQTRMDLAQVKTRSDGSEKRIFECSKCKFVETKLLADPIKSEANCRLAAGIRPPTRFKERVPSAERSSFRSARCGLFTLSDGPPERVHDVPVKLGGVINSAGRPDAGAGSACWPPPMGPFRHLLGIPTLQCAKSKGV